MKPLQVLTLGFFLCAVLFSAQWLPAQAPFDATAISRGGDSFWICGANSAIASSVDGDHWLVKTSKQGGGTLLTIRWRDRTLAAAGGTGGLVLLSTDGGENWNQVPTSFSEPVLDLSFADPQHGLVLTPASVLYTNDAGKSWRAVLPASAPESAMFKYVLAVAALDEKHAVVLVKEGPAQYYDGRIVATADGGSTWKTTEIEHTTLNNLLVSRGSLWLVGTEVVDREKGGGHAVPVTFSSQDAITWNRGPKPLLDTNYACRPEGCLMWNGAWSDTFAKDGSIHVFPALQNLSVQWSATENRICTLTPQLRCADTRETKSLPEQGGPAPQLAASLLQATGSDVAGKCIRCDYPRILVNQHYSGQATVKLSVVARADGTVSSVEILSTPDAEVGSALQNAIRSWIFYPILRDGTPMPTRRTVELGVKVVKP